MLIFRKLLNFQFYKNYAKVYKTVFSYYMAPIIEGRVKRYTL